MRPEGWCKGYSAPPQSVQWLSSSQAASGIDEVTVRHHLQKLVAAGLVAEERQGRQKFYTLNSREASSLIYQLSLLLWYPPVKAEETA